MVLVDTCGWIEWLTSGSVAKRYEPLLGQTQELLVPTLIQFELYNWVCRERDEPTALEIIGLIEQGRVIPWIPRWPSVRRPGCSPQAGAGRCHHLRDGASVRRRTGNVRQPFQELARGKLSRQEASGKVIAEPAARPGKNSNTYLCGCFSVAARRPPCALPIRSNGGSLGGLPTQAAKHGIRLSRHAPRSGGRT